VTSTTPSARNTEEGIQLGSQTQQEDELVSSDAAVSTDMSDMGANFNTVNIYRWQDLSDNYGTYFIEHKKLPDEAALTGADVQRVELLLADELATSQTVTFEGLLDKALTFKSVLLLFRPINNFTKYTVQTETSNSTTNILVEAAVNSSLSIALILMNETKVTQQVNTFLNNLNVTFITPPRTNRISVQMKVPLTDNINSTDIVQKHEIRRRHSKEYHILKHYIDPTMYTLILIVGLLGNGMLLFIFVRHRKLRTTANLMIIHLAICDIINLSINAPLHFYFKYDTGSRESLMTCLIVLSIRQFVRCAAALAVITLIIKRFIIIHPAFIKSPSKRRTTSTFTIVSIITVWVLPIPIALPTVYVPKFYEPICNDTKREGLHYVTVLNLVLYCLIMPSLMFGFSTQIARRLNRSIKNIPGEICQQTLQESRIRSARMMMALAVVFVITYCPFQLWVLLVRFVRVDTKSPVMIYALHFTKQLLFANGCFNPIAMFAVSSTLRKFLVRHVNYSSENGGVQYKVVNSCCLSHNS
jgi:gastrin-releasing peptide receptor